MFSKPMLLNEKLGAHVLNHWKESYKTTELFGLEVELEGKGGIKLPPNEVYSMWAPHNDGSLRALNPGDECIEYVSKNPYNLVDVTKSVKILMDFLNLNHIKVYDSYRTSIHVHINCIADTLIHVYNFITLAILFDELFVSQNGEHRIGNNFCLRSGDAQGQIQDLIKSIEMHGSIFGINGQNRYNSVNFASLLKFGTVEFRSLECTTDTLRILHWIKTIYSLKQSSRLFTDPQDIIRKFSQISMQEFMYSVLGPSAEKYMKVPGYENMMFNGMRLAQDFAFCSKWIHMEENVKDPPKNKAKKNAEIQQIYNFVGAGGGQMLHPAPAPQPLENVVYYNPPQPGVWSDDLDDDDDDIIDDFDDFDDYDDEEHPVG